MQSFKSYDSNNNLIGLIINPELDGSLLNKDQLNKLLPIIRNLINKNDYVIENYFDQIIITKNGYLFNEDIDTDTLETIVGICFTEITEKVIVRQMLDSGPLINHRVFHFNIEEPNLISIRFVQLGKDNMNSFDSAIKTLEALQY